MIGRMSNDPAMFATLPAQNVARGQRGNGWYHWLSFLFILNAFDVFGVVDRLAYGNWAEKTGDIITLTIRVSLILQSLVLFGYSFSQAQAARKSRSFSSLSLVTVAFLFVTALWSSDPGATIRASI